MPKSLNSKKCDTAEASATSNALSKVSTTFGITLSESPLAGNLTVPCPVSLDFVCDECSTEVRGAVANSTLIAVVSRSGLKLPQVKREMRRLRASCGQNTKANDFRCEVSVGFLLNSCDERSHACDSAQPTENSQLAGCEWSTRTVS